MGFDEENRSYNDLLDAKQRIAVLEAENERLRIEVKEWDEMCGTLHGELQDVKKKRK